MRPVAVFVLLAAACNLSAAVAGSPGVVAPLFAWGTQKYFISPEHQQGARRASYQVYTDLKKTLQNVVHSAVQPDTAGFMSQWLDRQTVEQQSIEVVLVVMGSQLKTSDLRSKAVQSLLEPLQSLMDKAESSLSVPYVVHEVSALDDQQNMQELVAQLGNARVVGCSGAEAEEQSIAAAVEQLGSEPAVILLCTKVEERAVGTPEGVAAELKQLQEAHDTVAALNKRQMTVYAVRPDANTIMQQRRRLQAVNTDVGVCGELCQTQVKWLEGILAALLLAVAAFSGMCCLYMLDTPTRFEKPKEGARND